MIRGINNNDNNNNNKLTITQHKIFIRLPEISVYLVFNYINYVWDVESLFMT